MPNVLTDLNEFHQQVVCASNPAIVEFGAEWCGTCQILSASIRSLLSVHPQPIDFYQVDYDRAHDIVNAYSVGYLPTYLLFKDGQVVDLFRGALSREALAEKFQNLTKATTD